MASETLLRDVKKLLIEVSNLPDITPDTLDPNMPLFRDGLGLDSIDVLELVVSLDKKYGLKIKNDEKGRAILHCVQTIADAIEENEKAKAEGNAIAPLAVNAE